MIPLQFLIQRRIISLPANISAHLAAKTLCDSDVGCLLVTGPRGELAGIATDRDLACSVLGEKQDTEIPLFDVMTANPLTVEASADLEEVIHVMEEGGIRRVPVV